MLSAKLVIKVGVLIVFRNQLLLIKEKSRYDNQYHWNTVGGKLEPKKDKSLLKTAERESKEEAGAKIKNLRLFSIIEVRKNDKFIIQVNFLADLKNKTFRVPDRSEQKKHDEDIVEVKLFNKKILQKMKRKDFINDRAHLTVREWLKAFSIKTAGTPRYLFINF